MRKEEEEIAQLKRVLAAKRTIDKITRLERGQAKRSVLDRETESTKRTSLKKKNGREISWLRHLRKRSLNDL